MKLCHCNTHVQYLLTKMTLNLFTYTQVKRISVITPPASYKGEDGSLNIYIRFPLCFALEFRFKGTLF